MAYHWSGLADAIVKQLRTRDWSGVLQALDVAPPSPISRAARAHALRASDDEAAAQLLLRDALAMDGRESPGAALLREWLVMDGSFDALAAVLPPLALNSDAIEERLLAAVRAHRGGDLATAKALCEAVMLRDPQHAQARAHRARALHNLGARMDALAELQRAVALQPDYVEGWNYLGFALRASQQFEPAITAFEQALSLRPSAATIGVNLGKTLYAAGEHQRAADFLVGQRARFPESVELALDHGIALQALDQLDQAERVMRDAVTLQPTSGYAWYRLGALLNLRGERVEAEAALRRAISLTPSDFEIHAELARLLEIDNRLQDLSVLLGEALPLAPAHPGLLLSKARLLRRQDDGPAAITVLRSLSTAADAASEPAVWYELARNLERGGDYAQAWQALMQANGVASARMQQQWPDQNALPVLVQQLQQQLGLARPVATRAAPDATQSQPVFLIGFPRSGITLLNLMLGCHSQVSTLEEKPTIEACVEALAQSIGYPAGLSLLTKSEREQLRSVYWKAARLSLDDESQRPVLVDMFPLRTLHVQLMAELFPHAKFIYMRRHPCDVVLSNLMQDYSSTLANAAFTDSVATARLYAGSAQLWALARERLSVRAHEMAYESLVAAPQEVLAGVCEFLGLAFEQQMLSGY
ncbi:MAG: sulfotransferase, partial [Lysobacteraceae bacterium]